LPETKLKQLVEASGGSMMSLADNADPEIHSVRPGRAASPDWIGPRRNGGIRWRASTSRRCCRNPGGAGVLMAIESRNKPSA